MLRVVDPVRDIEIINLELICADLEVVVIEFQNSKKSKKWRTRSDFRTFTFNKNKRNLRTRKIN